MQQTKKRTHSRSASASTDQYARTCRIEWHISCNNVVVFSTIHRHISPTKTPEEGEYWISSATYQRSSFVSSDYWYLWLCCFQPSVSLLGTTWCAIALQFITVTIALVETNEQMAAISHNTTQQLSNCVEFANRRSSRGAILTFMGAIHL